MAAEAAVSSAVQILGNLLIEKVKFLLGVEEEVEWLKEELKRMQCFLKDAAEKQANSEGVRNWISEIREVANDAEDAIEIFVLNVENARRRGPLGSCACFPDQASYRNRVGVEIQSMRQRLQDIESSRQRYGIQDLGNHGVNLTRRSGEVEWRRRLAHWQNDKDVVGLEADVKLLLEEAILDRREGLSMATIVGIGGIGKSTLARKIYNHAAIAAEFEFRVWVVVSSEFTPQDIIKQIMMQIGDREKVVKETRELEESITDKLVLRQKLQEMLYKQLESKRYFIVVDDVWEQTHWESLENAFPNEDKGSRLLLTSRNQLVTKYTRYVHSIKFLDPDESWELFLKKAFVDGKCPEELENIGREILKKCNGLPLAINVIGGLLMKQAQSKSRWEKVLKEMKSHLNRSGSNTVFTTLELSYNNLPPQLKPCFLCLAFFKEDATIKPRDLVNIWIAQGFIPQEGEETMEDIARGYLDELINRNMVQVKEMDMDGQVKTCHVHDLLRELSIKQAKEEISFEVLSKEGNSQSLGKPRHRVMYCSEERFIDSTNQDEHLRSLFIYGVDGRQFHGPSSYFKSFEVLRVLYFENLKLKYLPSTIGLLIGLRYLGLRNTRLTKKLPRWLSKLKNLQVLDLRGSYFIRMPKSVLWKMESLRHVYADGIVGKVPLIKNTLKNLQTVRFLQLRDSNVQLLKKMTGLCKLGLDLGEISDGSKLFAALAVLENLVHLQLIGIGPLSMDGLGTLHHLTHLALGGFWEPPEAGERKLPSASNFPPNLSHLALYRSSRWQDQIPVLEKLPELLSLTLHYEYGDLTEMMIISNDGFPKLKQLRLVASEHLTHIKVGEGAMPELKQLEINDCPRLMVEELPAHLRSAITSTLSDWKAGVSDFILSNWKAGLLW